MWSENESSVTCRVHLGRCRRAQCAPCLPHQYGKKPSGALRRLTPASACPTVPIKGLSGDSGDAEGNVDDVSLEEIRCVMEIEDRDKSNFVRLEHVTNHLR